MGGPTHMSELPLNVTDKDPLDPLTVDRLKQRIHEFKVTFSVDLSSPHPKLFEAVNLVFDQLPRWQSSREVLQRRLKDAPSFRQWEEAALLLDEIEGKDAWRYVDESPDYDYVLLRDRLASLRAARESGDIAYMIFQLRTSLTRNLADIGNSKLYTHCRSGTKRLIEEYMNEVLHQLDIIVNTPSENVSDQLKLEFLASTRQSYGRTALLLSGGATLGLYHIGVAHALYEARLLPRIISGASVGSIIAAIICSKTDNELNEAFSHASELELRAFSSGDEDFPTLIDWIARFATHGHLVDSAHLKSTVISNVGEYTFAEAYNRTRRILNITVSSSTKYEQTKLLNYVTAPNVLIWSAVCASCAVPFVFAPVGLLAKDVNGNIHPWKPADHCYWIDGSVESDLPMGRLSELFNVNHFIVSQVNPHVVPFLEKKISDSFLTRFYRSVLSLMRLEALQRLGQLMEMGVFPSLLSKIQAIASQRYVGDITIIPEVDTSDLLRVLSNPDHDYLRRATEIGQQAAYPKMSLIRNHCGIELFLDEVLYRIRLSMLQHNVRITSSPFTSWNAIKSNGLKREASMPNLTAWKNSCSFSQLHVNGNTGNGSGKYEIDEVPEEHEIPLQIGMVPRQRTLTS